MSKLYFARMICVTFIFWAAATISSSAQTLTTLVSFDGTNGKSPQSLMHASDGNFYGVTSSGGANGDYGTIFKITPDGVLTTLYSFCSQTNCTDGEDPIGTLLQAKDGNFYGTTYLGGSNCVSGNLSNTGCGTVFKITPDGQFTSLYSFCPAVGYFSCPDGATPYGALIQGADGNLYGTTPSGGNNAADNGCACQGFGTVFKITTSGQLTTMFQFCNDMNSTGYCLDGAVPFAGLLQTSDGSFYGTLYNGGTGTDFSGGTVYKLSSSWKLTTLHNFGSKRNWTDGAYPFDSLIQAKDGNFYGTTRNGGYGGTLGQGTVFKITPAGVLTTLHRFHGEEGGAPYASLVQGANGNLYGTNSNGGPYSSQGIAAGTIFKVTTTGQEGTVYAFCSLTNCTDGYAPTSGLVQGTNGDFYGVTYSGGASNNGTVYKISLH